MSKIKDPCKAFTLKADKLMRVIYSPLRIRQTEFVRNRFHLKYKDMSVTAIWDTGATMTVIHPKVVAALELKSFSKIPVQGISNRYESSLYNVDLLLPNNVSIHNIKVAEAKDILGCDVLIGMDVITIGDFAVTNADKKTCISFRFPPKPEHIDYATEMNRKVSEMKLREKYKQDRAEYIKKKKKRK